MAYSSTRNKIKSGSVLWDAAVYVIAVCAALATVYPFIYIFSMSISEPANVLKMNVWLFPKGFSFDAYEVIVRNPIMWRSFFNTVLYSVGAVVLTLFTSVTAAYPLSRKRMVARPFFKAYLYIPLYFNGGLISTYILVNSLGLANQIYTLMILNAVSIGYIIYIRFYFMTIPDSLPESAYMDGANDFVILYKIMLPLSKPILAVVALYTAVSVWNDYFMALIYLTKQSLHPLQVFLMRVLVQESGELKAGMATLDQIARIQNAANSIMLKYAVIIFTSLPIICVYPFLQKYFVKGSLVGSLKE